MPYGAIHGEACALCMTPMRTGASACAGCTAIRALRVPDSVKSRLVFKWLSIIILTAIAGGYVTFFTHFNQWSIFGTMIALAVEGFLQKLDFNANRTEPYYVRYR